MANADVLRLQTNVPETIALEFTDGLPVSSKFGGDQIMFSLTDGRKMFLAPAVARKIADAGVKPGQDFQLCKREVTQGNRRIVEYQILSAETVAPAPALASNNPLPVSKETASPAPSYANGRNGIHAVNGAAAPAPFAPSPSVFESSVALMKTAACGAIDVVIEVENYARSKGMVDFAFDPSSIQDLVSSLFIEMCKKAGRA